MNRFITGLGRSGTYWVSTLLQCHHEYGDYYTWLNAWDGYQAGDKSYAQRIYQEMNGKDILDVSRWHRFFIDETGDAEIALLVRNPIDTIASLIAFPSEQLAWTKPNHETDRFRSICRDWVQAVHDVLPRASHIFTLEGLVTNYEEAIRLCKFAGVDWKLAGSTWYAINGTRINCLKEHRLNRYEFNEWTSEEKAFMFETCGETMKEVGYWNS